MRTSGTAFHRHPPRQFASCECSFVHLFRRPLGNSGRHVQGNVIMDAGLACITDVGVYTSIMQTTHGHRVPIPAQWPYKSPDELVNGICTLPDDVYSFACTAYSVSGCSVCMLCTGSDNHRDIDLHRGLPHQMQRSCAYPSNSTDYRARPWCFTLPIKTSSTRWGTLGSPRALLGT